jgi:hypothetical protein
MKIREISQYFGGRYMRYWYVAFAAVMIWFIVNLLNNSAVSKYEFTAFDSEGNVLGKTIVQRGSMVDPERLPVTKAYKPIKPIGFLD